MTSQLGHCMYFCTEKALIYTSLLYHCWTHDEHL